MKSALTTDRGEYRLFWLPPGEYYVSTIASTARVNELLQIALVGGVAPTGPKPVETYAPVYYPGTTDAQAATQVKVRPGGDLGGIDFTLVRVIPRKIRGVVVDAATGQPVKSANV